MAAFQVITEARKRFEADRRFSLDTLLQYGFDLSERLGTILVSQQDFSDLPTIKNVFRVLFPSGSELHEVLADRELWNLYQRRHLVVHRCGIVDQAYIDGTGESYSIGTRLIVTPDEFVRAIRAVRSTGKALLEALVALPA